MTPDGSDGLERYLRERRDAGRKILAPYLTCGFPSPDAFPELLRTVVGAGADMLEIGIPYSDPVMDGPVIQAASDVALKAEMRPRTVLRTLGSLDVGVPFVFMTYCNPVFALGVERFARDAADAGAAGVIVVDLPAEEAEGWVAVARDNRLAPVFLAAPTTPNDRIAHIVELGGGFVYCVSLLGVTGVRSRLSERAKIVVERVREMTERPALVGLGVSTPEHAVEASAFSDGVLVGSAVIKAVMEDGIDAAGRLVRSMRDALDRSPR